MQLNVWQYLRDDMKRTRLRGPFQGKAAFTAYVAALELQWLRERNESYVSHDAGPVAMSVLTWPPDAPVGSATKIHEALFPELLPMPAEVATVFDNLARFEHGVPLPSMPHHEHDDYDGEVQTVLSEPELMRASLEAGFAANALFGRRS